MPPRVHSLCHTVGICRVHKLQVSYSSSPISSSKLPFIVVLSVSSPLLIERAFSSPSQYTHRTQQSNNKTADAKSEEELVPIIVHSEGTSLDAKTATHRSSTSADATDTTKSSPSTSNTTTTTEPTTPGGTPTAAYTSPNGGFLQPTFFKLLALDPTALSSNRETLRAAVEMGTIVLWFFIADRTSAVGAGPKEYVRDVFLFIFASLTLVAASYPLKKGRAPVLVNRQQTEEWKGWMQVLFLLLLCFTLER